MAEPPREPPQSTFVLRFTRDWSATSCRWRGRIEHVQSGRRADFIGLEGVLQFLRQFGVTVEDHPPTHPGDK